MFAFFTPGPMELAIIGIIMVLLFGHRFPSMMRSLGSAVPQFKKGLKEVEDVVIDGKEEIEGVVRDVKRKP